MTSEYIKDVLSIAAQVVLSRSGDVDTEDGSFATVDTDLIIRLESAISQAFDLPGDDVNEGDIPQLHKMITDL